MAGERVQPINYNPSTGAMVQGGIAQGRSWLQGLNVAGQGVASGLKTITQKRENEKDRKLRQDESALDRALRRDQMAAVQGRFDKEFGLRQAMQEIQRAKLKSGLLKELHDKRFSAAKSLAATGDIPGAKAAATEASSLWSAYGASLSSLGVDLDGNPVSEDADYIAEIERIAKERGITLESISSGSVAGAKEVLKDAPVGSKEWRAANARARAAEDAANESKVGQSLSEFEQREQYRESVGSAIDSLAAKVGTPFALAQAAGAREALTGLTDRVAINQAVSGFVENIKVELASVRKMREEARAKSKAGEAKVDSIRKMGELAKSIARDTGRSVRDVYNDLRAGRSQASLTRSPEKDDPASEARDRALMRTTEDDEVIRLNSANDERQADADRTAVAEFNAWLNEQTASWRAAYADPNHPDHEDKKRQAAAEMGTIRAEIESAHNIRMR